MYPLINRRIYDSDDENWKENTKKSLHDPMNLQKDSNKDSGETSKSNVVKIQQKKKKEAANIVVRPTLSRVSILVLKTVVEISKNFKESNMYQKIMKTIIMYHEVLKICYNVSFTKFNNCVISCA